MGIACCCPASFSSQSGGDVVWKFLLLDLLQAWFSFLLFHSLRSEGFCACVLPDLGWCVQMGCVCHCGLKSSHRLLLIPQPRLQAQGPLLMVVTVSSEQDEEEGGTRETSLNSGNKIQVVFSVRSCDPNVSLAHGSSKCGPRLSGDTLISPS